MTSPTRPHRQSAPATGSGLPRLLRQAERLRVTSAQAAAGRCMALSLELCLLARENGVPAELVVWQVHKDPNFAEHWAVAVGEGLILDPTRVQVDGRTRLRHAWSDYPASFTGVRTYPASLLLPGFDSGAGTGQRVPPSFMWTVRWRLLRHDLAQARQARRLGAMASALLSAGKFALVYPLDLAKARLERRRNDLLQRVR